MEVIKANLLHIKQERIDEMHRCRAGRTALLVIDMQRGFLEAGAALEVPQGRQVVPNVRRLIEVCRTRTIPVVHTQFVYSTVIPCLRGDPFGPEHLPLSPGSTAGFGRPSGNCLLGPDATQGPNSAESIPELAPRPGELVIAAHTYDKFYGTPLEPGPLAREDSRRPVIGPVARGLLVRRVDDQLVDRILCDSKLPKLQRVRMS